MTIPQKPPVKVFVSYNRKDARWLEELKIRLAPLLQSAQLELWDDTRIVPGTDWKNAIANAISAADIGSLLVTPYFLASQFIAQDVHEVLTESRRVLDQVARNHDFFNQQ